MSAPSKGPVVARVHTFSLGGVSFESEEFQTPDGKSLLVSGCSTPMGNHPGGAEALENARLLAEALNVLHESGMRPRELLQRLRDSRAGLDAALRASLGVRDDRA